MTRAIHFLATLICRSLALPKSEFSCTQIDPSTYPIFPESSQSLKERFSQLSATDRYEIMNNGSNSGHFWHLCGNLKL
jgi:hypothetical protein